MKLLLLLVVQSLVVVRGQHAPPGVNPTHYKQQAVNHQPPPPPPPPSSSQQNQFQGHQPQQQQFQGHQPQQQQFQGHPPQQQQFQEQRPQQQQVPLQAPAQHQAHQHQPGPGVFGKDMQHEKEHMKEHMDVPIDTSSMSEQELQFHYFKMHDSDGNGKLDGCELVKSLIHWHDQANHDPNSGVPAPEEKLFKDNELEGMIDPILAQDDRNSDGYIDYSEFVLAQQAATASAAKP